MTKRPRLSVLSLILTGLCIACRVLPDGGQLEGMSRREEIATQLLRQVHHELEINTEESLIRARAFLKLAEEVAPGDPRVPDGYGCVAWRMGRYDEAEQFFAAAVARDSQYGRGYGHLALVAHRRGDVERAERYYQESLRLAPLDYRSRNNFAVFKDTFLKGPSLQSEEELWRAYLLSHGADEVVADNLRKVQHMKR